MFQTRNDVELAAKELPCLRHGVLVDWRRQVAMEKDFTNGCQMVVSTMEFLAGNDDITVVDDVLPKILVGRFASCTSRNCATKWIEDATQTKAIIPVERRCGKTYFFLPRYEAQTTSRYSAIKNGIETEEQEQHLVEGPLDESRGSHQKSRVNLFFHGNTALANASLPQWIQKRQDLR